MSVEKFLNLLLKQSTIMFRMKKTFIDLFSGCGGFSRGFYIEGYKPIFAIDKDEACVRCYNLNFSEAVVWNSDIKKIIGKDIIDIFGYPEIVIASPPCEAFTLINNKIMRDPLDRLYSDPRGRLTLKTIELIGDLQPEIFIIENVPGILVEPIPEYIKKEFERIGYKDIYFNVLEAHSFGVPSYRRRVFISNIKLELSKEYDRDIITVEEALEDLPDPRYPNNIPNHSYIPLPEKFREKVKRLKWGRSLEFFLGRNRREYGQYIRLHPKKIAPTIMGKSRFIHPYQDRLITVREQARLMSYPDNHIFYGVIEEQYNQVGESVPPLLSQVIANYIKK